MTAREKAILAAIVCVGIVLRLIGIDSFPHNSRELLGGGWPFGPVDAPVWIGRAVATFLSSAAILTLAWPKPGSPSFGAVAAVLLAVDPLSILAAHESPKASLLQFGAALLARAIEVPRVRTRLALAIIVFVGAVLTPGTHPSSGSEPALAAWYGESREGFAIHLAAIHHLGYATLPLALGSFFALRGFAGAAILAGFALARLDSAATITDFSLVSPFVACAAATTIAKLRAREIELGRAPLAVPALLLVVAAVHSPVLLSDALTGLRYPWTAARRWLEVRPGIAPNSTVVYSPDVDLARAALGPSWNVEPITPAVLADRPTRAPGNETTRVVLIPVSSGIQSGRVGDPPWLTLCEARKVPDFAPLARRFDLYRLELRIFVLDP